MTKKILILLLINHVWLISSCTSQSSATRGINDKPNYIATKQFIWEDSSRTDSYYGRSRLINTQVWYPSINNELDKEKTPYFLFFKDVIGKLENWSENDYKSVQNINTNSALNAEISSTNHKKPLVIFSPSLGGNLSYYTYYAEFLAQQGYIVMGINHLYESEVVISHDKTIFKTNQAFHDSLKLLNIPEQITADKYREVKGERQKVLAEDLVFSLNQILNEPSFQNIIDDSKIAAFGHSIGGAAVVYLSILDKRIKAVINLDGTPPTIALINGIDVPFLFIEDLIDYENHQGYAIIHKRRGDFCELNRADSYRILIGGFNHNSFLDINYYLASSSENRLKEKKNLDLVLNYISTFLNTHLLKSSEITFRSLKTDELEIFEYRKN